MIRYSNRHPITARGLAETVNGNLKGADKCIGKVEEFGGQIMRVYKESLIF
jgi:hypothetical protein